MLFNGEVAVVTGAAQGIGKAITEELCINGAKVAIVDINEEKGIACAQSVMTTTGGEARFFNCNVMYAGEITKCIKEIIEQFGRIIFW